MVYMGFLTVISQIQMGIVMELGSFIALCEVEAVTQL